jgi:hypothetical protein
MSPLLTIPENRLGSGPSRQPDTAPVERRAWVRHACRVGAFFMPFPSSEVCYSGTIQDISRGGVTLVSPRPFEEKTQLVLLLKTAAEAKVFRARATADGKWVLGCGFTKELADEELQTLVVA